MPDPIIPAPMNPIRSLPAISSSPIQFVGFGQSNSLGAHPRGRLGFFRDRFQIYGTGGFAFSQTEEVGIGDADGQTARNQGVRFGWVLGAGIEYVFASNMTAAFEYLHMDFGRQGGLGENCEDFDVENHAGIVRAGLNFKF